MPPLQVLILYIVVQQREIVDQLERRGSGKSTIEGGGQGFAGKQAQGGA